MLPKALIFPFFAILLGLAAGIYVGFALVDESAKENAIQWISALVFAGIALAGLWVSPLILAAGWAAHGIWDLLHHKKMLKTRVQKGYPLFCLSYDLIVAAFLVYLEASSYSA